MVSDQNNSPKTGFLNAITRESRSPLTRYFPDPMQLSERFETPSEAMSNVKDVSVAGHTEPLPQRPARQSNGPAQSGPVKKTTTSIQTGTSEVSILSEQGSLTEPEGPTEYQTDGNVDPARDIVKQTPNLVVRSDDPNGPINDTSEIVETGNSSQTAKWIGEVNPQRVKNVPEETREALPVKNFDDHHKSETRGVSEARHSPQTDNRTANASAGTSPTEALKFNEKTNARDSDGHAFAKSDTSGVTERNIGKGNRRRAESGSDNRSEILPPIVSSQQTRPKRENIAEVSRPVSTMNRQVDQRQLRSKALKPKHNPVTVHIGNVNVSITPQKPQIAPPRSKVKPANNSSPSRSNSASLNYLRRF